MKTVTENSMPKRVCPVCGRSSSRPIMRQSFGGAIGMSPMSGYDVVVCDGCGAGFAIDIPSQEQLDAYYRDLSKYEYAHRSGHESEDDERRLAEVAEIVDGLVPDRNVRVLEIGCGNGRLLAHLRQRGFRHLRGIDPSPSCSANARELYGIEVLTSTLAEQRSSERGYGLIIMTQVLEHIRDLRLALQQVFDLLDEAGLFYADVPDVANFTARADAPYQEFSTEHINYFSRVSLANALGQCGFETVVCESAMRTHRIGSRFPVVHGLFRKTGDRCPLVQDDVTEPALQRYVAEGRAMDETLRTRINRQVRVGEPLVIWGTGTHTQRLLACGILEGCSIVAFVDSNPKYQGRELNGRPILAPHQLIGRSEAIMISSFGFQNEILRKIRGDLKLTNKVITLYEIPEYHEQSAA